MLDLLNGAPVLDQRDAERIAEQVRQSLRQRIPDLEPDHVTDALIAVFARYSEILIQRINRAPHKALLTFVNLLGLSPRPPQPACVPLTFSVVPKCQEIVKIQKGIQVAGPSAKKNEQPVVFETEENLWVSATQLVAIMSRDPQRDTYSNLSPMAGTVTPSGALLFDATSPTEHSLYLGHSHWFSQPCHEFCIEVQISESQVSPSSGATIQWQIWNSREKEGVLLHPVLDETSGLTCSGHIIFPPVASSVSSSASEKGNVWLRGRLLTPLVKEPTASSNRQSRPLTPHIQRLTLQRFHRLDAVKVAHAFVNQVPFDTSKEWYLFGEKPKFGDVLYLGQSQALGEPGGRVTIHVELLNPQGGDQASIRETFASGDLRIQWDISSAEGWKTLGVSQAGAIREDAAMGFRDGTKALTQSGTVVFVVPLDVDEQEVNGVKSVWVRARILAGDYGKELIVQPRDLKAPEKGYVWTAATLASPIARSIRVSMENKIIGVEPEAIITCNDVSYEDVTTSVREGGSGFTPFVPMEGDMPVLHLGFRRPDLAGPEAGYPLNLYFCCQDGIPVCEQEATTRLRSDLDWEYWNGAGWSKLSVVDHTATLSKPGIVQIYIPSDWRSSHDWRRSPDCDMSLYWIRMRTYDRRLSSRVQCRGVMLHTVMAQQATTLKDEVLGSSNGTVNQSLRTLRTPILQGQILEVCEPSHNPGGDNAWVKWNAVEHFLHSGPHDRHYTIDRQSGVITFGDGHRGAIPPSGVDNIVLKEYRIGGGSGGNVPAEALTQLRTTIPFVQQVSNRIHANGGADAESLDVFVRRALRVVRHGNRAVTSEDYEDMALAASPFVARAHCIPSYDLGRDPFAQRKRSGVLSMIVLPRADSEAPKPDEALLEVVRAHLEDNAPIGADICVVAPRYVPVNVEVHVVLQPEVIPAAVEQAIKNEIDRFLHPVSGGSEGQGWKLGSYPAHSSLHGRLMKVPGVHHIRRLHLNGLDESSQCIKSRCFHVCSGIHGIHCESLLGD